MWSLTRGWISAAALRAISRWRSTSCARARPSTPRTYRNRATSWYRRSVALFTRLADSELAEVAAEFALGALRSVRAIHAGTINSNFAVDTERGVWFVRINEGKSEADVAWEARLVEALAAAGVATPPPMLAHDGRPYAQLAGTAKWVSVFPWTAGHHLDADRITPDLAAELGAALARLHAAGLDLPLAWRRRSIYDHAH